TAPLAPVERKPANPLAISCALSTKTVIRLISTNNRPTPTMIIAATTTGRAEGRERSLVSTRATAPTSRRMTSAPKKRPPAAAIPPGKEPDRPLDLVMRLLSPESIKAPTAPTMTQAAGRRKRSSVSFFKRGSPLLLLRRHVCEARHIVRLSSESAIPGKAIGAPGTKGQEMRYRPSPRGSRTPGTETVTLGRRPIVGQTAHTLPQPARLGRMRIVVPAGGIGGARFLR